MAARSFLAIVGLVFVVGALAETRFDGYSVYRVYPVTKEHITLLRLQANNADLDYWSEIRWEGKWVDIQVTPTYKERFLTWLDKHHFTHKVIIEDLQRLLDEQKAASAKGNSKTPRDFTQYHDFDWIMAWLDQKAAQCGTSCSTFSIGTSVEGRPLKVLKISTGGNKPALWIDGGIHAREWIAPATTMYFIDRFITDMRNDTDVVNFLNLYDVYFLTVLNPDGYVYTWTDNRTWRKNRSIHPTSSCFGADVNRNFDHMWNTVGTSTEPCSDTFAGTDAFSEPEAKAVGDYVTELNNNQGVQLFLTLHSYGQLLLLPYGYTTSPPETYDQLFFAGQAFESAVRAVHGTLYTVGSASVVLYASSGTSRDWAYGIPRIPYVYTIELRDTGLHGFVLPPEQILPTGEETWAGFKALVKNFE